jgi:trk system potassium uptake protein
MTDGGNRPLRVLIMGCGRTGSLLARLLDDAGHHVTIVDWSPSAFARLPESFGGETVIGNALDQDVLRRAGIEHADAFVAATSGDNRNIVASEIAESVFQVPRVVARIKDQNRAAFFSRLGIRVDCRTEIGARVLLDLAEKQLSQQTA